MEESMIGAEDVRVERWLEHWRVRLGIARPIHVKRISRWDVCDDDGRRGCSLVGVIVDVDRALILHTRRLTEENIVHELLHVAHRAWTEDQVVEETTRLMSAARRPRRARRPASMIPVSRWGTSALRARTPAG